MFSVTWERGHSEHPIFPGIKNGPWDKIKSNLDFRNFWKGLFISRGSKGLWASSQRYWQFCYYCVGWAAGMNGKPASRTNTGGRGNEGWILNCLMSSWVHPFLKFASHPFLWCTQLYYFRPWSCVSGAYSGTSLDWRTSCRRRSKDLASDAMLAFSPPLACSYSTWQTFVLDLQSPDPSNAVANASLANRWVCLLANRC